MASASFGATEPEFGSEEDAEIAPGVIDRSINWHNHKAAEHASHASVGSIRIAGK
jgi:hypothetical protein